MLHDQQYPANITSAVDYYSDTSDNRRKILIVDDEEISRSVLCRIFDKDYTILTAENGQDALNLLNTINEEISLSLLDLIMPVLDGYKFLHILKNDSRFSSIPVIVTTAKDCEEDEIWCLQNGAADFISKPYNPEVAKHRAKRIINLCETSAMLNAMKRDPLTGLYNKESFYLKASQILEKNPYCQYDMVVADSQNFKVVTERLGLEVGDLVLRYRAERYQRAVQNRGICTRLHDDVFAILIEHGDESWKSQLLWQWDEEQDNIPLHNLVIKYGIYENVNRNISPSGMCDRAMLAMNRVKKLYGKNISIYDDSFRSSLLREQQILDSMEQALTEHQFQIYYQPKYDINTEHISGAEALVRWIHPELGFLSPGEFIPLFEKNGFITKLDLYVWEQTCKDLLRWKNEGRSSIPVSVNISRADFSIPDLADRITDLVDSYCIERELLHLEITESVYMDEPQSIIQTINTLRANGFKIEMDDFGSGYSSLNMLSELSIDILKLDMKFIQKNSQNKRNILGFIISLSKWMNLTTIAEGVETQEHVDKLRRFGCDYVQGYFFAKPMPAAQFEHYLEEDLTKTPPAIESGNLPDPSASAVQPEKEETLLLVEDNEMNRSILRHMLNDCYHIREVSNGKEAYDYLLSHPDEISVILLDMVMPVMDGFQFMKLRNQDPVLSRIPVIITSESETDSECLALRLGAERFIGKPYDRELLLLSVSNAIKWHKYPPAYEVIP